MSDSANWHDTKGNVIKNWKMKAQKVWFTDDHNITAPERQRDPTIQPKSKYPKLSDGHLPPNVMPGKF